MKSILTLLTLALALAAPMVATAEAASEDTIAEASAASPIMGEALDLFDEATALHEVLGPEFARVYGIVKRAEYEEFLQVISPWEREHLLMNV